MRDTNEIESERKLHKQESDELVGYIVDDRHRRSSGSIREETRDEVAAIEDNRAKKGHHYRGESFGNSMPLNPYSQRVPPLPIKLETKPHYSPLNQELSAKIETDSLALSQVEDTTIRNGDALNRQISKTDSLRDLNTFFSKSDPVKTAAPYADRSSNHSLPREISQRSLHSLLSQQELQQMLKS
jgi:hypothetical protein